MKTQEELVQIAKEKGFKLEFHDSIEKEREYHYWYGGNLVTITDLKTKEEYDLWANGDVYVAFYEENENEQSVLVKDKNNSAIFYNEMTNYIENDKELDAFVANGEKNTFPSLEIDNNNWFELFHENSKDSSKNFEEAMDASYYSEALEEAIDLIIEFKE